MIPRKAGEFLIPDPSADSAYSNAKVTNLKELRESWVWSFAGQIAAAMAPYAYRQESELYKQDQDVVIPQEAARLARALTAELERTQSK